MSFLDINIDEFLDADAIELPQHLGAENDDWSMNKSANEANEEFEGVKAAVKQKLDHLNAKYKEITNALNSELAAKQPEEIDEFSAKRDAKLEDVELHSELTHLAI